MGESNAERVEDEKYAFTTAFAVTSDGQEVEVRVCHETKTGRFVSVFIEDKYDGHCVQVPAWMFDAMVAAVNAKKEY